MSSVERRRTLFTNIGLKPKFLEQLLSNELMCQSLENIISEAGVSEGCSEDVGRMLLSIAQNLKQNPFALANRCTLVEYVMDGRISSQAQMSAAINFFKKNGSNPPESFDISMFESQSGVGVVVTEKEISSAIDAIFEENKEKILEERYHFSLGVVQGRIRAQLPFADGSVVTQKLNQKMLDVLGPKTEADMQKRKKVKVKTPKNSSIKATSINAQMEEKIETADDIEKHYSGRELDAAVNTPELLAAHNKITGGKIRTRFPPEPNGFLHIGHAKAMNFNFGFARAKGGTCFLRYDDTNPSAEDRIFIESIQDNVRWLGHSPDQITYSSECFDQLYDFAVELIRRGKAYVCHQKKADIQACRALKQKQPPSPWRDTSVEENLAKFEKMRIGGYAEGEATLRMKIDITSPNPCMWDPVAYRVKYESHPHVGDKWCVYPSYDFTHCLVDSLEHITHSLCTLEFEIRRDSYYWLLCALDLYRPMVWEYSRLNITYNVLSKRKLKQLVEDNYVSGWDDPRLLTINGLRRRGYTPTAIADFCARVGVTRSANTVRKQLLEACIRQELDDSAPRSMVVLDPLKVILTNYPDDTEEELSAAVHPKQPAMGTRTMKLSKVVYIERSDFRLEDCKNYYGLAPGKQVKLKFAYPITCDKVIKDAKGDVVELQCTVDTKSTGKFKGMLHWVSGKSSLDVEVRVYSDLFTVESPGDDWLSQLNPQSLLVRSSAKADVSLAQCKCFDRFQFERVGYFVVDQSSSNEHLVFNQTVTLRDSKEKREM